MTWPTKNVDRKRVRAATLSVLESNNLSQETSSRSGERLGLSAMVIDQRALLFLL
jgi:hypothetical protein